MKRTASVTLAFALAIAGTACDDMPEPDEPEPTDEWDDKLAARVVDYNAALRVAALRLTGHLPTLAELKLVELAGSLDAQKQAYESLVAQYMTSPRFAVQMFRFWGDTLKMGGATLEGIDLDSAPAFAAQLVVQNRSYLELLTATGGTCGAFDRQTGTFSNADCNNGTPTVGLLTHPGVQAHFFSNLAFRRTRWVQETFACTKFPAEIATSPTDVGGLQPYTGTFPFQSIAGKATGGRVDFLDTESIICANCHSNMNHIAPLFAYFDQFGQRQSTMVAPTPLPNAPPVEMRDYLPTGEGMAWRFGKPVSDMASLGRAMADDRAIAECAVARVWNWALGKGDIVDTVTRVPSATIQSHVDKLVGNGHRLRDAIYDVFTSDDFVRF